MHALAGKPAPGRWAPLVVALVCAVLLSAFVAVGRLLHAAGQLLSRPLRRVVQAALATLLGIAVVLLVLGAIADRFVVATAFSAVDSSFDSANNGTRVGIEAPDVPQRSGSPASWSPWDELGVEGRSFVGLGADAEELTDIVGATALEPIRVYAGLDSSEDLDELAELVVAELDRTGAFDRAVLCVTVPTGRGWVNPSVAQALEFLYAGDSAIASMQYTYLPSPLSFLVDPERAKDAGRALFDAVYERWSDLPEGDRPRVVVSGESLGSTGARAPFSGLEDLRVRTDGALFIGPRTRTHCGVTSLSAGTGEARRSCPSTMLGPPLALHPLLRTSTCPPELGMGHGRCSCRTRRTRSCGGLRSWRGNGRTGCVRNVATT